MLKKLLLLSMASSSLFAVGEAEYDAGVSYLKEARSECQRITDWKLKEKAYSSLDAAVIVLDKNYFATSGEITSNAFFSICNALTHTPDQLTLETLEKISKAETKFRSHLMANIKYDMAGGNK